MNKLIKPLIHRQFKNKELEEYISSKHKEFLHDSKTKAKILAEREQPGKDSQSLFPFIEPILRSYNELLAHLKAKLNGYTSLVQGASDQKTQSESKEKFEERLAEQKKGLRGLKADLLRTPKVDNRRWKKILFWLGIIAFAEVFYNSIAISSLVNGNKVLALFVSATFTFGLLTFAYFLPRIIGYFKSRVLKISLILISGVFIFSLFFFMGNLRKSSLDKMSNRVSPIERLDESVATPNDTPEESSKGAIFLALTNCILLYVTALATHYYKPSDEEIKKEEEYNNKQKELSDLESNIDRLETENTEMVQAFRNSTLEKVSYLEYCKSQESLVISHFLSSVSAFKEENIFHRSDDPPNCFADKPPKLKTYFQDIQIINNK